MWRVKFNSRSIRTLGHQFNRQSRALSTPDLWIDRNSLPELTSSEPNRLKPIRSSPCRTLVTFALPGPTKPHGADPHESCRRITGVTSRVRDGRRNGVRKQAWLAGVSASLASVRDSVLNVHFFHCLTACDCMRCVPVARRLYRVYVFRGSCGCLHFRAVYSCFPWVFPVMAISWQKTNVDLALRRCSRLSHSLFQLPWSRSRQQRSNDRAAATHAFTAPL